MAVADPDALLSVREGSQRLFVTAAIDFMPNQPITEDELLRASFDAMSMGADAVHHDGAPRECSQINR